MKNTYPAGALVRISDICRHQKTGKPGLLPIDRSTWHRWLKNGTVPAGLCLAGSSIKVWPIEVILNLASPAPGAAAQTSERQQSIGQKSPPPSPLNNASTKAKKGGAA